MKKIKLYIVLLISISVFAQVEVTTLTTEFKGSGGLSLDNNDNLYIGDFGDFLNINDTDGIPNNIMKLDENFNLSVYASGFVGASGNAFDNNGVLYQSDIRANAVYKIENGNKILATSTGISLPVGLTFDDNNNLYVCNCGNNTIRKVTPSGVSTLFASGSIFQCPNGITIDEDNNLYVSNFSNGSIIKITPDGIPILLNSTPGGSTGGPSNGHLDYHEGTRTLFIASHASNKVYSLNIDNASVLNTIAGSGNRGNLDGNATEASFSRPNGVVVTKTGDSIYINSAIPIINTPNVPLNPQVIRLITGLRDNLSTESFNVPIYNLKVYPNPSESEITIKGNISDSYSELEVKINNLNGKHVNIISNQEINNQEIVLKINLNDLSSGQYILTIEDSKNIFHSLKLIKK